MSVQPLYFLRNRSVALALAGLFGLNTLLFSLVASAFWYGPDIVNGIVYTRAVVTSDAGNRYFAEYDKDGKLVDVIGEENRDYPEGTYFMSADDYRVQEKAYQDFLKHDGIFVRGPKKNASVMSRQAYLDQSFGSMTITTIGDKQLTFDLDDRRYKPAPRPGMEWLVVKDKDFIADPRALGERGMILFESPLNLKKIPESNTQTLLENAPLDSDGFLQDSDGRTHALLIGPSGDSKGEILYQTKNNIGYRAAYFKKEDWLTNTADDTKVLQNFRPWKDKLWGPVDATVEGYDAKAATFEGKFKLIQFFPPCPGFSYSQDYNIWVKVPYRLLNPQVSWSWANFYFRGYANHFCSGYGARAPGYTLGGLMAQMNAIAIEATMATPMRLTRVPVDIVMFTGRAKVGNPGSGEYLQVGGETTYDAATKAEYNDPTQKDIKPQELDLDANREAEHVSKPVDDDDNPDTPKRVWVYFSGDCGSAEGGCDDYERFLDADGKLVEPDIKRLADQEPDFEDRGLLKTISAEDLKKTDIYVFRASNGQMVFERNGLTKNLENSAGNSESLGNQDGGVEPDKNRAYFRLTMPGPHAGFTFSIFRSRAGRDYTKWQQKLGVVEELRGQAADVDSLRDGEKVHIILINRETGYIASRITEIKTQGENSFLDVQLRNLVFYPPNLKIWAKRNYRVEKGATKGEERNYTVGNEGAGLTSDHDLIVFTEWMDQNGSPLPRELPGYTGRLAKIVGDKQVGNANQVEQFEIKPGRTSQLIKLKGDIVGTEHFYLQVSGRNKNNPYTPPDFSPGAGEGVLQYRPKHYVPVKVPLYDELATRRARNAAIYAHQDDENTSVVKPEDVQPVYRWVYRPEYQFSMYELKISEINRVIDLDGDPATNDEEKINILNDELPVIVPTDKRLEVIYDYTENTNLPLDLFGPGKDIVFSLEGYEQTVTIGSGQQMDFNELLYLDDVNSETLIALRLLQNSDSGNVLYEWVDPEADLLVDFNRDGKIEKATRNNEDGPPRTDFVSKNNPFVFWINDDDDNPKKEDNGADTPGYSTGLFELDGGDPDYDNDTIDGTRDLVDFFPVWVNIREVMKAKESGDLCFELSHKDEALNFVYTSMKKDKVADYLRHDMKNGSMTEQVVQDIFGKWRDDPLTKISDVPVHQITSGGEELDKRYLRQIEAGTIDGVILIEVREATTEPLKLTIIKKRFGTCILGKTTKSVELYLKTDSVEKMYRMANIRGAENSGFNIQNVKNDVAREPELWPDNKTNNKHMIFAHGYNVPHEDARGWVAEVYKRFWHSGSNAKFTGISWNGSEGGIGELTPTPDYWANVINAQDAAWALSEVVNSLSGVKVMLAHSLGNMLTSEAIQYHNMRVQDYIMIDAAVASEGYSKNAITSSSREGMRHPAWAQYVDDTNSSPNRYRLWASEWHLLFSDERNKLTWRNRYKDLKNRTVLRNFYSSGEEVLQNGDGALPTQLIGSGSVALSGKHAWFAQEVYKGDTSLTAAVNFGPPNGGWGFNNYIEVPSPNPRGHPSHRAPTPGEAKQQTNVELEEEPVFRLINPETVHNPSAGSEAARVNRSQILATAIPALSFAAGSNHLSSAFSNTNMMDLKNGWPKSRSDNPETVEGAQIIRWKHSDLREIAYLYNHRVFDKIVSDTQLGANQ